jgi:methyltransferase (TIGR00027 family)
MTSNRASLTAERVAARRAAHRLLDSPLVFDDPLAMAILSPPAAERVQADPQQFNASRWSLRLRAGLVARSRFAEDTLRARVDQGVRQYVVLGAGFDTFAYRNPYKDLRVFEVDHPATQTAKRTRLTSARIDVPASVTFVPVDFSQASLRDALAAAGFSFAAPAAWSWLGVVPYLDRTAIRQTLSVIGSQPAGTTLVFDYGTPVPWYDVLRRLALARLQRRLAAIGEPWKTLLRPEEARVLLLEAGFRNVEDLDSPAIDARYFAGRSDGLRTSPAMHLIRATV